MNEELSGVLTVNKHGGLSSHDVVNRIRRLYGTKKVGHTGTLDPMAEGVLPVLIGRAAKAAEYLGADEKEYIAGLKLGITTDTEDTEGKVLTVCETLPSEAEVFAAAKSFIGDIKQVPPMYSAIKIDGRKLVDMARRGIEVERPEREITVRELEVETVSEERGEYRLRVLCSKGTYIRTLCADIGKALGCGGAMSSLCRTRSGIFMIDSSYSIKELEQMSTEEREALLLPVESLFAEEPSVTLNDFFAHLARCGCEIYLKKIKVSLKEGDRAALYDKDGFFALAEVRAYEEGLALKTLKLFRLEQDLRK
jgi:tRNA pseudouridine55 synthase